MTRTRLVLTIGISLGLLAAQWSMKIIADPLISSMVGMLFLATVAAIFAPRDRSRASRLG